MKELAEKIEEVLIPEDKDLPVNTRFILILNEPKEGNKTLNHVRAPEDSQLGDLLLSAYTLLSTYLAASASQINKNERIHILVEKAHTDLHSIFFQGH